MAMIDIFMHIINSYMIQTNIYRVSQNNVPYLALHIEPLKWLENMTE